MHLSYMNEWCQRTNFTSPNCTMKLIVSFHRFKGALSRYSVFYVDFLRSKMAARRLEDAAPANEKQAFVVLFFLHLFRASRSIDVSLAVSSPCKVMPLSNKVGLWDYHQESEKKENFALNNGEKFMESKTACRAPRIKHGPTIVQDSWSSRCSGVYFATQYNVHYGNRQLDICWALFVWKAAQPPLFFPQQNGAKNHWIAWQCTFKGPGMCHIPDEAVWRSIEYFLVLTLQTITDESVVRVWWCFFFWCLLSKGAHRSKRWTIQQLPVVFG